MSEGVCHLCFERSNEMKYDFQQNVVNTEIQEFVETFCQFVFNEACAFEEVCLKCWQTLCNFNQFCEKIRGIHQSLIEVSSATGQSKYDEQIDVLKDETEEHLSTEENDGKDIPLLSIETDLGDEGEAFSRRTTLTAKVIKKLEEQLEFEAKNITQSDMCFDRISRFVSMECNTCKDEFESLEECNDHYLHIHGRSAYWNCCNLLLETPYDVLDHIKYHESIDVFKCAACSKCFLSSNKLKYHIRRSHLPVDGLFDCTICDKECKSLRLLLNHQKMHIRIECPYCSRHFSAANYDHHIRSFHASNLPKKRKSNTKLSESAQKKSKQDGKSAGNNTKTLNRQRGKDAPERKITISIEPNESGMYECDICSMQFKQISLVFSHRNKVHV